MRIGLTFDLRSEYLAAGYDTVDTAEFDQPETIDAIAGALIALGDVQVDRIGNAKQLAARLVAGDRWDLVFNICEGLHGFGRESLVPALLDAWQIPYVFSDPLTCAVTLHKGMAKHIIRDQGIPTPDFAVIEHIDSLANFNLPWPVFAKPVAEGTGKGICDQSCAGDIETLRSICTRLMARYQQPVLVETWLPGREFTVGIVGTGPAARCLGTMEILFGAQASVDVYTHANKEHWEGRIQYRPMQQSPLLQEIEVLALRAWQVLGCRDGGRVDIRLDRSGVANFLEVNPLAGLHPDHSDLPFICRFHGIPYQDLISQFVDSALRRTRTVARKYRE